MLSTAAFAATVVCNWECSTFMLQSTMSPPSVPCSTGNVVRLNLSLPTFGTGWRIRSSASIHRRRLRVKPNGELYAAQDSHVSMLAVPASCKNDNKASWANIGKQRTTKRQLIDFQSMNKAFLWEGVLGREWVMKDLVAGSGWDIGKI